MDQGSTSATRSLRLVACRADSPDIARRMSGRNNAATMPKSPGAPARRPFITVSVLAFAAAIVIGVTASAAHAADAARGGAGNLNTAISGTLCDINPG